MLAIPRWKMLSIAALVLLGLLFAVPSFFSEKQVAGWPAFAPRAQINLGLDLSGGSQILLEADTAEFVRSRLETKQNQIEKALGETEPRVAIGDISRQGGRLSFLVRDPAQVDDAVERIRATTQGVGLTGQRDFTVEAVDGTRIVVTPTAAGLADATEQAMNTATDVIRRRIDALGTKEPTIIRQGDRRILVQVPGVDNPEQLKALIGRTARLEFKLVDLAANPAEVAAGRAPIGSQILPSTDVGSIAVKRRAIVTGEQLVRADPAFDQQNGQPVVTIGFDPAGGRSFARATQENVGKPFAIILDDVVLSAPNINEPILGGTAQISGSFTTESANELAIALRSGSLPVELQVIEERTVGPDLGADSIRLGVIASIVATIAVIGFMLLTYGRFGIYATVALMLNALLILGIMAIFNSTLTLPGIAGFVLTIGAAVDANVLINERIREEQRRGRRILDAIETGYREASTAIFDANITNVIAAALMYYFGSGPIRGFALVLMIGIITSVFTAVTLTRIMVALWVRRERPRELVI